MKPLLGMLCASLIVPACLAPAVLFAQEPPESKIKIVPTLDRAWFSLTAGGAFPVGHFIEGGVGQAESPGVGIEAQARFPLTQPSTWELGGVLAYREFMNLSTHDWPPGHPGHQFGWDFQVDGEWKVVTVEARLTRSFGLRPNGSRFFAFFGLGLTKARWDMSSELPEGSRSMKKWLSPAFTMSLGAGKRWSWFFIEGAYRMAATNDIDVDPPAPVGEVGFALEWGELNIGFDIFAL